ncbi:hypothetical protein [Streptomyces sp. PU_AKi4]|uniref:hypothetical protein n=1 Tax=Streptomyces sp. PU_AKi4 TaxID=2800809 RepID=UPI0035244EF1
MSEVQGVDEAHIGKGVLDPGRSRRLGDRGKVQTGAVVRDDDVGVRDEVTQFRPYLASGHPLFQNGVTRSTWAQQDVVLRKSEVTLPSGGASHPVRVRAESDGCGLVDVTLRIWGGRRGAYDAFDIQGDGPQYAILGQ